MHTVRIEGDGMRKSTRVYIDGMDISNSVTDISINIGVDKVPSVHLDLKAYVELPDELKALVCAGSVIMDAVGFEEA